MKKLNTGWSIRNLYFYLVCLVTLFLVVGGAISTVNSAMQLILPDRPNIPLIGVYSIRAAEPGRETVFDPPPLEELEARRAERESLALQRQDYVRRNLLNTIALMIIPLPFYLYHWKQIKPGL